jgi:hypothetical protein
VTDDERGTGPVPDDRDGAGPAAGDRDRTGSGATGADELNRLAELLMRLVRDEAIDVCDRLADGRMGGPDGRRWREVLESGTPRDAVRELIPDVVDQVLFQLLDALDGNDIPLGWRRADGSWVSLYDLGRSEMGGWLMGTDSWRERYSTQRFFAPEPPSLD